MSGQNDVPVPSGHPDNDLLADLVAEVLPGDLALQVQHHVRACGRCAAVMADAESVRTLLLQIEPEVMPVEVLTRLERSLAEARRPERPTAPPVRSGSAILDSGETVMINRVPGAEPPPRKDSGRRIVRSGPATGRMSTTGAGGPMTGRLNRMTSQPLATGARRQAIEEQKADLPSRWERFGPILKIAAGVLVVAGIGVVGLQFLDRSGSSADTTAASGAVPVLTPVQSTTTDYAKGDDPAGQTALTAQVKKLVAASQAEAAKPEAQRQGTDTAAADGGAQAKTLTTQGGAVDPKAPNQLLRDPAKLRACLKSIDAGDAQPVAIDLARYNKQEAAIIVLPAAGGVGYDVWVVARNCQPGSDGTIDVVTVKS